MESNSVGALQIVKTVDMFPRTNGNCLEDWRNLKYGDINRGQQSHVETVALLSKIDADKHLNVEIQLDELNLTSAEIKASYAQIME